MKMRNGLIFILLLYPIIYLNAQEKKIKVSYNIFMNSGFPVLETGELIAKSERSLFTVAGNEGKNLATFGRNNTAQIQAKAGETSTYINFSNKEIISKSHLGEKSYKVKEDLFDIKWRLINEDRKKINGFSSRKAIGEFRGRTYVAWYTLDIPISAGPWKFHGLPGLILEIEDTEGKFQWQATDIKYPYSNMDQIKEPNEDNLIEIKLKDFVSARESHLEEQKRRIIARMPPGGKITISEQERGFERIYEWEEKSN